ncbi:LamG domain-containing protein [Pilimelia anulata]|uniref:LamG domain-containing protein n=1 Tax=Pilimelia anulata TaxID=53371 RepID=UPI00166EE509|nr:LamG domain-containing protein [Pilimelia anulata]
MEITAGRSETRAAVANPDGSITETVHTEPVRTYRAGRWHDLDPTLRRASDRSWRPVAAALDVRVSGGGADPLLTLRRVGRELRLSWPERLPEPAVTGARATYAEVRPGVDLVVTVSGSAVSHVLVVKDARAARALAGGVEYALDTSGLSVQHDASGRLSATDLGSGVEVFGSARPRMWDSRGLAATRAADPAADPMTDPPAGARVAVLDAAIDDGRLRLKPPIAFLAEPAIEWPLYVDPVLTGPRRSAWAMVAGGEYANEEYWRFDGAKDEGVGRCPDGTCNGVTTKRLYYTLPTSFRNKTILSAEFAVTQKHSWEAKPRKRPIQLYRALSGISKNTNWNNAPKLDKRPINSASPVGRLSCAATANRNARFNAISAVRLAAASNGPLVTTFGLRAKSESDVRSWRRFCDNAMLTVRYNTPPSQPAAADLTASPGGLCTWGSARPTVREKPDLYLMMRDPDRSKNNAEKLSAEVRLKWTVDGKTTEKTVPAGKAAAGSRFTVDLAKEAVPENTTVQWSARAKDEANVYSPYNATPCEFVVDSRAPAAPDIDSEEFLPLDHADDTAPSGREKCVPDTEWRGYPGRYGTFRARSTSADLKHYLFAVDREPTPDDRRVPSQPGGEVSERWMANRSGTHTVFVKSVDAAGNASAAAVCQFAVPHRPALGEWRFGEEPGAAELADEQDQHPLVPGAEVQLRRSGPGCAGRPDCVTDGAVGFAGTPASHLATRAGVVDTTGSFAVSTWVRLADETASRAAVSQDGTAGPAFGPGFDAGTKRWVFRLPHADGTAAAVAGSDAPARTGVWTHLLGAWDKDAGRAYLVVGAQQQRSAVDRRAGWAGSGPLQVGRQLVGAGTHGDRWIGEIAATAVYDRVVVPAEITELSRRPPGRVGYWQLNAAPGGVSPELGGVAGTGLTVGGGAVVYQQPAGQPDAPEPLVGSGHLVLDGRNAHAGSSKPMLGLNGSFTLGVRTRLPGMTCGKDMAAVAQVGARASLLALRCSAAGHWELVLSGTDADKPTYTTLTDPDPVAAGEELGQHLAATYDAVTDELVLWVDGRRAASANVADARPWKPGGALQLGRMLAGGTQRDPFAGVLDELRVYDGVADAYAIQAMASPVEDPDL